LLLTVSFRLWYRNAARELADEIRRVEARGEPVWFADLAPRAPEPGENGTGIFLAAVEKLVRPSQAFLQMFDGERKTPPGDYEAFRVALDENRPALELMRQAVRRPFFRLLLDYTTKQPISILLEPIQQAHEFSRLLKAEALQAIGAGNNDRAVAAILDGLLLSEMLRDEPLLIIQLVRVAIAAESLNSLETLLAHGNISPEQFTIIDEQLALMERRFRLAPAMIGERAMALTTMHHLGENTGMLGKGGEGTAAARILSSMPARPYRMSDEAFLLRVMTRFADNVDRPGPEGAAAIHQGNSEIVAAKVGYKHIMTTLLAPAVLRCRNSGLGHRQRLINARVGLRVARFHADRGKFPDSLDDIADEQFASSTADLLSTRPLVYRLVPDGFVIYSVGENHSDDGGGEQPDEQEHRSKFEVKFPAKDETTRPDD
jgi:hypothetical protein